MPIYEYECNDCEAQVELFFRSFTDVETKKTVCPRCQGTNLTRLISKVRVVSPTGGETAGQVAATSTQTTIDQDDPKALAQTMRRASKQELGSEFNEVASRLERGEKATSIEKSLRQRAGEAPQTH